MKTQHDHYDRLSVRLSIIISRLQAGEFLKLKTLADEFSVPKHTLQQDFQQRLLHLYMEHSSGSYRLIRRPGREYLPNTLRFFIAYLTDTTIYRRIIQLVIFTHNHR